MNSLDTNKGMVFTKRYQWLGILVICLASIPLHFIYDWTGGNNLVGLFGPINESIWEHLKLVFWPLVLWWGIGYIIFKNKKNLSLTPWFTGAASSIVISMVFIVAWYYTWTNAFGVESSIIDIGSLFIAVPISQLISIHIYRVIHSRIIYLILSISVILLFAILFIWFTFTPPNLPLFIPPN